MLRYFDMYLPFSLPSDDEIINLVCVAELLMDDHL